MTNPVKSEDSNIEDILAAIRLQAAARVRPVAIGDVEVGHEPPVRQLADLPLIIERREREAMASVYPFPRVAGSRLADVLRRAQELQDIADEANTTMWGAAPPVAATVVEEPVRREMVSFCDTRMSRMSAPLEPSVMPDLFASPMTSPDEDVVPPAPAAVPEALDEATAATGLALSDGAAELLRPMLKQWLSENMPRIVEKALHMEIAAIAVSGNGNLRD